MTLTSGEKAFRVANGIFFVIVAVTMLYPLWYILMFSLSESHELSSLYLWPNGLSLRSYETIFREGLVVTGFRNSVVVVAAGTAISMALTILAAYPLSRRSFFGRKQFMAFVLFTMIFNGGMIPTYLVVRSVGMVNTLWALFMPKAIIVYNLLIMIRFFANIPDSLIESAYIDGANDGWILFRVILPLSTAVLAAIGLFYAVFNWNAYLPGLIYINDAVKKPLQTLLYEIVKGSESFEHTTDTIGILPESIKMATAFVTVVPILVVYPFLQKYFVKGVMLGSVKG